MAGARPRGGQQNEAGRRRQALADQRAVRAVELRITKGWTYAQIGTDLGITSVAAQNAYTRGLQMSVPQDEIETAKATALAKLDRWEQMVLDTYHADHVVVSFGRMVTHRVNGQEVPLQDHAPRLAAIRELVRIERERRAIVGYSAPSKRVLEVITEDAFDRAIKELNEQAERLEQEAEGRALNP